MSPIEITTGKKKVPVVCLADCRLRPEKKKVPVVCLAGMRSITTGKKKDTIVIFVLVQLELNLIQIH